jgi:hypothetical protein
MVFHLCISLVLQKKASEEDTVQIKTWQTETKNEHTKHKFYCLNSIRHILICRHIF